MILKTTIFLFSLYLFIGCQFSTDKENKTTIKTPPKSNTSIFLIDYCNNNLLVELEEDMKKGKDSCVLRIRSLDKKLVKNEILNVPVDRCSINRCEKDYVSVAFSCGGPCYSHIFVFTDQRKNKQFEYCQTVSNNPNIVTHIKDEAFEKLLIHNLKNGKELTIKNPNTDPMTYGSLDSLFIIDKNLIISFTIANEKQKKKIVNIEKILQ